MRNTHKHKKKKEEEEALYVRKDETIQLVLLCWGLATAGRRRRKTPSIDDDEGYKKTAEWKGILCERKMMGLNSHQTACIRNSPAKTLLIRQRSGKKGNKKKNLCALNGESLECQHQSYRPTNAAAVSLF
jgi:hypothetical protein